MGAAPARADEDPSSDEAGPSPRLTDDRRARVVFVVALIVGLVTILWFGRHTWFKGDEWSLLADREATDLGDVFRPQNRVHWVTIPMLVYRAIYAVFGLHSYLPYQVPVVLFHLTLAVLLRRVMLRVSVDPWIATAAAGAFIFFGAGRPNLVWGFQITLVGSLMFGLVHMLLATHEGPVDRRDWLGLASGAMGLLCSGLGPTMTITVGLAVLALRGWRVAALHTVPLGVMYLIWWFGYASTAEATDFDRGGPSQWIEFAWNGLTGTFSSLGQVPGIGAVLAVLLVVGLALAWAPLRGIELRRRAAIPAAMLAGALLFLLVTALGRVSAGLGTLNLVVLGTDDGDAPRYLHVVATLVLPALAVAADAVVRRWRATLIPMIVLLLVGVPGNIDELADPQQILFQEEVHRADRRQILAAPRVAVADDVPGSVLAHPRSVFLTIGWLRQAAAEGKLPDIEPIPADLEAMVSAQLVLVQVMTEPTECTEAELGPPIELQRDESLTFVAPLDAAAAVVYVTDDGTESPPRRFIRIVGPTVVATTGPITLRVEPNPDIESVSVCR